MTGKEILDALTVFASICAALGVIYAMFAKWSDNQVKIAKENSLGAEAMAKMAEANAARDQLLAQLKATNENINLAELRRENTVRDMITQMGTFQNRIESRIQKNDDRLVKTLESIARRNPFGRRLSNSTSEQEDSYEQE